MVGVGRNLIILSKHAYYDRSPSFEVLVPKDVCRSLTVQIIESDEIPLTRKCTTTKVPTVHELYVVHGGRYCVVLYELYAVHEGRYCVLYELYVVHGGRYCVVLYELCGTWR